MSTKRVETTSLEWSPGSPIFGPSAVYNDHDVVQMKVLSDRRPDGGGLALLVKFSPPEGKLIKIVAVARSDEHTFLLEGGAGTKGGQQLRFPGQYVLNPSGQPHSAFIAKETVSLVVYTGEPDEIVSIDVVDGQAE